MSCRPKPASESFHLVVCSAISTIPFVHPLPLAQLGVIARAIHCSVHMARVCQHCRLLTAQCKRCVISHAHKYRRNVQSLNSSKLHAATKRRIMFCVHAVSTHAPEISERSSAHSSDKCTHPSNVDTRHIYGTCLFTHTFDANARC